MAWLNTQQGWALLYYAVWGLAYLLAMRELRRIRHAVERPDDPWSWRGRR